MKQLHLILFYKNFKVSPVENRDVTEFFGTKNLDLKATFDKKKAQEDIDGILIATFTDYNLITNYLNVKSIKIE